MGILNRSTNLKIQLSISILSLVLVLIIGVFIFAPVSFTQIAKAITGNYSKTGVATTDLNDLDVTDWNNLDDDFVAKSGDTITGNLSISGNLSVSGTCTGCSGAGGGGGDTYINWGRHDCSSGVVIYSGYAFSSKTSNDGGSVEPVCIKNPISSPGASSFLSSDLVALGIGASTNYVPAAMVPFVGQEVKCAVCYVGGGTCYENVGDQGCDATNGFTPAYTGYSFGGLTYTHASYKIESNRKCLNENFDSSNVPVNNANSNYGAVWYATSLVQDGDSVGALYTNNSWLECSICCN